MEQKMDIPCTEVLPFSGTNFKRTIAGFSRCSHSNGLTIANWQTTSKAMKKIRKILGFSPYCHFLGKSISFFFFLQFSFFCFYIFLSFFCVFSFIFFFILIFLFFGLFPFPFSCRFAFPILCVFLYYLSPKKYIPSKFLQIITK